ncbi:hypothetical protein [uncultured Psychroserpens sp.]|uniref:hypothetical protein n=1 Tax=uncultured Psychroserpens sp. TaxID=255436 RepID=UPI00262841B9|nr:hypothetical protein [uncultured Psychroserpens sp.]
MKKILIALLFVNFSMNAQDAKVNSILKKHFKALNQTKLNTVKSLKIEGAFIQNGTALNLEILKQRPDKWRRKIELNKTKMLVVINGNSGWEINEFAGANDPVDYDEAKLNAYSTSATIDNQLWYYKNNGAKIKYLTEEVVNEKKTIKLEVIDALGKISHIWLDSKTHLINQTEDAESKQILVYKEYQLIDGIPFPKKVNGGVYELEFKKIELNPKFEASIFTKGDHMSVKDIAKIYLKAFYDLNYEVLGNFYTDESFWYDPSTAVINPAVQKSIGKDKIIADLKSGFNGVQDASYTFEKAFYSGPYVSVWGTYSYKIPAKFFQGMMHSDAVFEFNIPMVTNLVVRNGKVLEHLEYADWTDWAKQAQANAQKAK